ncbi:MAG: hypothetical protein KC505_02950 [Myxococcales bacterium]|nr:hypothetical protein [Myxococcales bacterium]USN50522.1 MAG: hypothetical protein H6731_09705 [Myxococcales bacterium]
MLASEIAHAINGRLIGDDAQLCQLAPLFQASQNDLSILAWPHDVALAKKGHFAALIIPSDWAADYLLDINKTVIVVEDFLAVFLSLKSFFKKHLKIITKNISPSARLNQKAVIGEAVIGHNTRVDAHACIGDGVFIGEDCHIGFGVVIHDGAHIGNNVVIGANSVIGAEAFAPYGYDEAVLLPSLGSTVIEDNIRIGSLCSVARGLIGKTIIKKDTLVDNQVHVGHDARVGKNVVIAGQTALAGFVDIGDAATLGGQVGVAPHAVIGQGARVSGKSLARGVIAPHEIWSGNPSLPHKVYLQEYARISRRYRVKNERK